MAKAVNTFYRGYDLAIKYLLNSKERDADEWIKLFEKADPRFRAVKIRSRPQSMLPIIEATWQGIA